MLTTEMCPEENCQRISASECYTPFGASLTSSRIQCGNLEQHEREALEKAQHRLIEQTDGKLYFLSGMLSVQTLRREALRMKREGGLDLIVVDYLQQMNTGDTRADRDEYSRVSGVSRALKSLTTELHCPVLAAVQYSREANKAERPMIYHLRGSGTLEQDANIILSLHRPSAAKPDDADAIRCAENCKAHHLRYLQLYVDKIRRAPAGAVLHYAFDGEHFQIFDARANFGVEVQNFV